MHKSADDASPEEGNASPVTLHAAHPARCRGRGRVCRSGWANSRLKTTGLPLTEGGRGVHLGGEGIPGGREGNAVSAPRGVELDKGSLALGLSLEVVCSRGGGMRHLLLRLRCLTHFQSLPRRRTFATTRGVSREISSRVAGGFASPLVRITGPWAMTTAAARTRRARVRTLLFILQEIREPSSAYGAKTANRHFWLRQLPSRDLQESRTNRLKES